MLNSQEEASKFVKLLEDNAEYNEEINVEQMCCSVGDWLFVHQLLP